jgi:hypothetical protein
MLMLKRFFGLFILFVLNIYPTNLERRLIAVGAGDEQAYGMRIA